MTAAGGLPARRLGRSDLEVPVVGLGCNAFGGRIDRDATFAVLAAALEEGVTFWDTADIYGGSGASETLIGEFLEGRRDEVVLATKFGVDLEDGSRAIGTRDYVHRAAEASLRRLRTDVIDLYQYHRPDGVTPIAETLGALDELVRAGTVRHVGCSNFSAAQLDEADRVAREQGLAGFVSVQNGYSLLDRSIETDVVPAAERLGIGVIPYFPLARGLLTGKYRRGERAPDGTRLASAGKEMATDEEWDRVEALAAFADERAVSLLDVAIGGLAAMPAVSTVIAGATRPEQVRANAAAGRWEPSAEDAAALRAAVA